MTDRPRISPASLEAALVDGMRDLGRTHGLPELRWHFERTPGDRSTRLVGLASSGDYDETDAGTAVRAWAHALELFPTFAPHPGTTEYTGSSLTGLPIAVWGVTDYDAFDADRAEG